MIGWNLYENRWFVVYRKDDYEKTSGLFYNFN